ncbi:MAG: molybdenum cofactor guanylyltransferase [Vulcanimicrobiaceae bacterium]
MPERPEIGVVIIAGGEASRLPGKLALSAGDVPMLVRVYRNVSPERHTVISCRNGLPAEIDALLPCEKIADRWDAKGPLCGLLSAIDALSTPLFFAVAGDAPFVDAAFVDRLAATWQPGDEAVVPVHAGPERKRFEPLAALYDRAAFRREGEKVLHGEGSMHAVVERLRVRPLPIGHDEERIFTNVNTPQDYAALSDTLTR